ncbi:hypothetical protein [Pseudomonas sp. 3A(2025)]
MSDHELWLRLVFYTLPLAMIMTSIALGIYIRRMCLSAMLESLKNSHLFSFHHARGLDYQGSLYRNLLVLDIGTALIFSKINIRSGVLNAGELARFSRRFRVMAVTNTVCFYGAVLAFLIVFSTVKLERFVKEGHAFDRAAVLHVLLYSGPVIALLIAFGLTVYTVHYRLHTMLDAIKPGPSSRLDRAIEIGEDQASWRSILFIKLSRAVLFKNRKKGDAAPDVFDLEALPVSFKRLALISLLCMYVGLAWLVVVIVMYNLSDTAA